MLCSNNCLVSHNVVSDESHVLDGSIFVCRQKRDELSKSALCVQQIDVSREMKYAEEFRSQYAMFINFSCESR